MSNNELELKDLPNNVKYISLLQYESGKVELYFYLEKGGKYIAHTLYDKALANRYALAYNDILYTRLTAQCK